MNAVRAPHSGLGIASLLLGIIGGAFAAVMVAAAVLEERGGSNGAAIAAIIAVMAFGLLLNLIGIAFGVASLFQRDRRRLTAVFGTILNACVLFGMAVVFALLLSGRLAPAAGSSSESRMPSVMQWT